MQSVKSFLKAFSFFVASTALALVCAGLSGTNAYAISEDYEWDVTYTADKQMTSTYSKEAVNNALASMQPGDSFTLHAVLHNQSDQATDWYMTSKAIRTLEETQAAAEKAGGAYSYRLLFDGQEIYSSDKVGGDGSELGFKEIANATGDWFLLGNIASNQKGEVEIEMTLDGETQGNAYRNTNGELEVAFAVEDSSGASAFQEVDDQEEPEGSNLPKTNDMVMIALYSFGILAALICLIVCLVSIRKLRKGCDAQ